jgi:hypothetical protein
VYNSTGLQYYRHPDCGDFCGDPTYIQANLATSHINSPYEANLLTWEGLQGFLPSVQQVS